MKNYKYKIITVLQTMHPTISTSASKQFQHNDLVTYEDLFLFASANAFILEAYQGGVLRIYDLKGVMHVEATLMDSVLNKGFIN